MHVCLFGLKGNPRGHSPTHHFGGPPKVPHTRMWVKRAVQEEDEDAGSALTYGDAPDAPSGSPGASFGDALAAAKADRRRRPRKRRGLGGYEF